VIAATPLLEACAALTEHWSPKVVGRVNDAYVKVAKLLGEFVWHRHEHEDEMFLVLKGTLEIRYEDASVTLQAGEFAIVPKGVLHQPVAREECLIALIEPVATLHTGTTVSPLTKTIAQQLA
jgi:mannose-6-phosphate isomerase-like protein (cupin superfamily)